MSIISFEIMEDVEDASRASISACVIARDEEARLPACLESVAFCDELVVVDSGSRDRTVEIARSAGARVVEQPWLGFAAQRNVALDHARGDWVLEIDADERVSPELRREIEAFLASPPAGIDIAGLPIRHRFLDALLGPSAKYPDYRHRLFRRGSHRHDESRTVHEGISPHGPVHPFQGDLEHLLAASLGEAARDAWDYARAEAAQVNPPPGLRPYVIGIALRPPAKLVHRLVVGGGWRDGAAGTLKVVLDAISDALVWTRALGRRLARGGADGPAGHFGAVAPARRSGVPHIVAVAAGERAAGSALAWLGDAAAAGADAALVTDVRVEERHGLRVRRVARPGPLVFARALEAEHQLRPIDALVPAGHRERHLLRLVPPAVRGLDAGGLERDPAALARRTLERMR